MIPADDKARMLISFNSRFPHYSFVDVVSNKVPPASFKNKIVIIAQSAAGLGTTVTTPIGIHVPAYAIIANTIDNILNRDHIVRPGWAVFVEMAIIILFGIFLAVGIPPAQKRGSAPSFPWHC